MQLRITVKTPKNQAAKCVTSQRTALIGHNHPVLHSQVLRHNLYYLVIETNKPEEITARCAKAETMIKAFYRHLIKWLTRANKLANKFDKGLTWIRHYLKSQTLRTYGKSQELTNITNMTDEELRELIQIKDLKEMQKLLAGELISITEEKP